MQLQYLNPHSKNDLHILILPTSPVSANCSRVSNLLLPLKPHRHGSMSVPGPRIMASTGGVFLKVEHTLVVRRRLNAWEQSTTPESTISARCPPCMTMEPSMGKTAALTMQISARRGSMASCTLD